MSPKRGPHISFISILCPCKFHVYSQTESGSHAPTNGCEERWREDPRNLTGCKERGWHATLQVAKREDNLTGCKERERQSNFPPEVITFQVTSSALSDSHGRFSQQREQSFRDGPRFLVFMFVVLRPRNEATNCATKRATRTTIALFGRIPTGFRLSQLYAGNSTCMCRSWRAMEHRFLTE